MKLSIILLAAILYLLVPATSTAQTYKMEFDALNALFFSHEITTQEAQDKKKALDDATDSSKSYPLLPYDTLTGTFNFTYILECPGVPKDVIHRRIKEWCALTYADIDNVLRHDDVSVGKIITKGYTPITYKKTFQGWFGKKRTYAQTSKCYHTMVFTSVEGKVKLEITEIRYSFASAPYYSSVTNSFVSGAQTEIYLNNVFPIIKNDQSDWGALLDLARQTTIEYGLHASSLKRYVLNWEKDYKF